MGSGTGGVSGVGQRSIVSMLDKDRVVGDGAKLHFVGGECHAAKGKGVLQVRSDVPDGMRVLSAHRRDVAKHDPAAARMLGPTKLDRAAAVDASQRVLVDGDHAPTVLGGR